MVFAARLRGFPGQNDPARNPRLCPAAGAAEEDRELVVDELAAAVGEDRRTARETRSILLAFAGQRALEPEAVQQHSEADRWTVASVGIA